MRVAKSGVIWQFCVLLGFRFLLSFSGKRAQLDGYVLRVSSWLIQMSFCIGMGRRKREGKRKE